MGAFKIKVFGLNKKGLAWGQDAYTEILGKTLQDASCLHLQDAGSWQVGRFQLLKDVMCILTGPN